MVSHFLPREVALVATLLRQRRTCALCHNRADCQLLQLLVPRQHGHLPFYEWFEAWLCAVCRRSYVDGFRGRGVHALTAAE